VGLAGDTHERWQEVTVAVQKDANPGLAHLERQSVLLRLTVHELRRPLTVVGGYLSMIRDGSFGSPPEAGQASRAVLAMAGAVREMAALTDGLAAVTRREDLADSLRCQRYPLGRLVEDAIIAVEVEAQARGVQVAQAGPEVEADVDPDLLRVAIVNLLGNAVQHSPDGSTVSVSTAAEAGAVTIAVTDHGPGIDAADASRVFDPWHRGPTSSGGLGLGLWIARQIVEWHGGRIRLESAPGQGSTFSVVVPSKHG
jgi:signal transduction histidine kinase